MVTRVTLSEGGTFTFPSSAFLNAPYLFGPMQCRQQPFHPVQVNTAIMAVSPSGQRSSLSENQSIPNEIKVCLKFTFIVDLIDRARPRFRFLETPGSTGTDLTVCKRPAAFANVAVQL